MPADKANGKSQKNTQERRSCKNCFLSSPVEPSRFKEGNSICCLEVGIKMPAQYTVKGDNLKRKNDSL